MTHMAKFLQTLQPVADAMMDEYKGILAMAKAKKMIIKM